MLEFEKYIYCNISFDGFDDINIKYDKIKFMDK